VRRRADLEVAEEGRFGKFQGGEDAALAGGRLRAPCDAALTCLEGHEVHALELVVNRAPSIAGRVLDDADQQQDELAELHVCADAVLAVVEDGPQTERPFQVASAALDPVELLAGGSQIGGRGALVGGAQQPLAVEAHLARCGGLLEAQEALLRAP